MNSRSKAVFSNARPAGFARINRASWIDTLRVVAAVVVPTAAKGVIIRRPIMERLAQRQGLDTSAVRQMQRLVRKYGRAPLLLPIPFRPELLILDPADVSTVLHCSPQPFATATWEKRAALAHFEPKNVLISDASRRAELRPIHEHALASADRLHPSSARFKTIVDSELPEILDGIGADRPNELDWSAFSQAWFRIVRRTVLGDRARNDVTLTKTLDDLRTRANWAFAASIDRRKLRRYQQQLDQYLRQPEEGSLISRLPKGSDFDLESQVAQWLFAFDAAGIAVFRTLALLACHPSYWAKAVDEVKDPELDRPFTRSCLLEALRLWPTTPVILRELTEDIKSGDRTVMRGTGVIIFAPFFHRDPELAYANRMEPSIWGPNDTLPAVGFVPFSAGAAICPAHNLVPAIASFAISALLSEADITLLQPSLTVDDLPGTLNHFDIRLRLSKRPVKARAPHAAAGFPPH
ncbi:cytochrome P450 [Rhizobium laguerreae]|uniref:cytochrome P450 n=1 Tax=Rhizobium laguerreae TaxID=1076926 RepID=UPI001C91183C|nr:cytochrome P450 [Rhizobium laguerreae]MBY3122099.1 cytochrome P450 [Rhizobium laguerreae]MBY3167635.1 cytochrome P450 [Rhizobium laguerreae]MBY3189627.1 cytochrome P450 [Rhizobium laguerreae]MBY3195547.1 cytochrome P450 [Rhizobium laguerreae]MBY3229888.1 cytochrome P450 [Rhizobium laguerreae]